MEKQQPVILEGFQNRGTGTTRDRWGTPCSRCKAQILQNAWQRHGTCPCTSGGKALPLQPWPSRFSHSKESWAPSWCWDRSVGRVEIPKIPFTDRTHPADITSSVPLFGVVLGCPCCLGVQGCGPEGLEMLPIPTLPHRAPYRDPSPKSIYPIPRYQSKVRDGSRDAAHSPARLLSSSLNKSPAGTEILSPREVAERGEAKNQSQIPAAEKNLVQSQGH